MVVSESYGEGLIRHYSDEGLKIRQVETDEVFNEAVDVEPCAYTYEETEEKAEYTEPNYKKLLEIVTGGESS